MTFSKSAVELTILFDICGQFQFFLTLTKWPKYEKGPFKNLKKPIYILVSKKTTKAFIQDTMTLLIKIILHKKACDIFI